MKFYKRDPDRALAGMAELTLKQRGAYNSLLDLLYSRDGDVPDNDERVARMMTCHRREWAAVKKELIALEKIWVEDGKLRAKRVQETINEASKFSQDQSDRASNGWQKRKKYNDIKDADMPHGNALTPTDTPTPIKKEEEIRPFVASPSRALTLVPPSPSSKPEIEQAVSLYNEEAGKNGWTKAAKITSGRRAAIIARLRENGLDGWRAAMLRASMSDFLTGRAPRGDQHANWLPDLDFFAKADNFAKLIEGKYDNRARAGPSARSYTSFEDDWRDRVKRFRDKGIWLSPDGPPPNDPDCTAPKAILKEFGYVT